MANQLVPSSWFGPLNIAPPPVAIAPPSINLNPPVNILAGAGGLSSTNAAPSESFLDMIADAFGINGVAKSVGLSSISDGLSSGISSLTDPVAKAITDFETNSSAAINSEISGLESQATTAWHNQLSKWQLGINGEVKTLENSATNSLLTAGIYVILAVFLIIGVYLIIQQGGK